MKKTRPWMKFLQLPLSVLAHIRSLTSKAASDLLVYLCQRTVGFGECSVVVSYSKLAEVLDVNVRTISRAAKLLEKKGYILRNRVKYRLYEWRVVICETDVISDPDKILTTRNFSRENLEEEEVSPQMSGPSEQECPDHEDTKIQTSNPPLEHDELRETSEQTQQTEQKNNALNNSLKKTDLKKQQHGNSVGKPTTKSPINRKAQLAVRQDQPAACKADEPLYKFCLRELLKHRVGQRMARKLCREHDHELIARVLKTAPTRPGIENLAGYIISEIQDGGYSCGGRFGPGGRRVDKDVSSSLRQKSASDAPRSVPTREQMERERKALEKERLQKEKCYREQGRLLIERFRALTQDVQEKLKALASVQLKRDLPQTVNREEMLKDQTFRRMANRSVLERFFRWVDNGLDGLQALTRLERSLCPASS